MPVVNNKGTRQEAGSFPDRCTKEGSQVVTVVQNKRHLNCCLRYKMMSLEQTGITRREESEKERPLSTFGWQGAIICQGSTPVLATSEGRPT
jgi:hypothetical protein